MTVLNKPAPRDPAPALFRLITDGALSRRAFDACGFPLVLLDASGKFHPVMYVNSAFEQYFGYREIEVLGRSLAALVFRGDEALLDRLIASAGSRWNLRCWGKDGQALHIELALGRVRNAEGRVTSWVLAFSDRSEVERLRGELESLRTLAATA